MFNFLLKQIYSDRRGTNKIHPGQNLPDKRPSDKTPGQPPHEQLRQNLYKGLLSGLLVLRRLKIGGGPRCVTYFLGGPGMCEKVGGG